MTCATMNTHRNTPNASPCPSDRTSGARRREAGHSTLGRLLAQAGEQLFHYRYVRAELIERALERREHDRGEQP